jgi:hypothetical protein
MLKRLQSATKKPNLKEPKPVREKPAEQPAKIQTVKSNKLILQKEK